MMISNLEVILGSIEGAGLQRRGWHGFLLFPGSL